MSEQKSRDDEPFEKLLERASRGDSNATGKLIQLYEPMIRREIRFELLDNWLRRFLDESDVCQSVAARFFVRLWAENEWTIDSPEDLVRMLKQMVKNRITDHARHWTTEGRDYTRNVVPDSNNPVEPVASGATPSRIVADAEILAEFERRLSEDERALLEHRRQGKAWVEVGKACGDLTADHARIKLGRAIDRVSGELGFDV